MLTHIRRRPTQRLEISDTAARTEPVRARSRLRLAALLAMTVGGVVLTGCAPRRAEVPAGPPAAPAAQKQAGPAQPRQVPSGARVYMVDTARSVVEIKVHRAGPLAKFGHNHVVTSHDVTGFAWQGRDPDSSGFEIHMPVATLVVDDPGARAAAGADFEGDVPESAREGTHANMLKPNLLDAAEFPEVVVRCAALGGTWDRLTATASVTIRNATREVAVPITVQRSADALVARGAFHVLQSDFGITPLSIAGGAIQVADDVELTFEITAVAR